MITYIYKKEFNKENYSKHNDWTAEIHHNYIKTSSNGDELLYEKASLKFCGIIKRKFTYSFIYQQKAYKTYYFRFSFVDFIKFNFITFRIKRILTTIKEFILSLL